MSSASDESGTEAGVGPRGGGSQGKPGPSATLTVEDLRRELDALFRSYHPELHRLAYLFVRSEDEAEDVVHDVYLRLLFRGPSVLPLRIGYVARAVTNAARDALRRSDTRRRLLAAWNVEVSHHPPPPETEADRRRASMLLCEAMGGLPPGQRAVFQRVHIEGASYSEVAAEMGISVKAVIQQAWRARRSVRERLRSLGVQCLDDL